MDDIVKKAMAKWPNVPDCYGWLALDARGNWRMRDERAQHLNLAGDKVIQPALLGFINRNYLHDQRGCWYFQNGPQRVFLDLESTPYVARTDPQHGLVVQTGAALDWLDAAYLTELGELIVQSGAIVAQVDDRDVAQLLPRLTLDGVAAADDVLLAWMEGGKRPLMLHYREQTVSVAHLAHDRVADQLGFTRRPAA